MAIYQLLSLIYPSLKRICSAFVVKGFFLFLRKYAEVNIFNSLQKCKCKVINYIKCISVIDLMAAECNICV